MAVLTAGDMVVSDEDHLPVPAVGNGISTAALFSWVETPMNRVMPFAGVVEYLHAPFVQYRRGMRAVEEHEVHMVGLALREISIMAIMSFEPGTTFVVMNTAIAHRLQHLPHSVSFTPFM